MRKQFKYDDEDDISLSVMKWLRFVMVWGILVFIALLLFMDLGLRFLGQPGGLSGNG